MAPEMRMLPPDDPDYLMFVDWCIERNIDPMTDEKIWEG